MLAGENPAKMAVDEARMPRRVRVILGIGVEVMVAMFRRPPNHALLRAALGKKSEDELEHPARRERPMRELTMIPRTDGKDAQPVERDADRHGLPGDARPDCGKAGEMHQYERNGGRIDDIVVIFGGGVWHERESPGP